MIKTYAFYKKYDNFMLKCPQYVQLLGIEAEGDNLYELLKSVKLIAMNGLGVEVHVEVGDLCNEDFVLVEADVLRLYEEQKKFETNGSKLIQLADE